MKLRNKQTGEIGNNMAENYIHTCEICGKVFDLYAGEGWGESYNAGGMLPKTRYVCMECIRKRGKNDFPIYRSLSELNEEWEDYEEPKECWHTSDDKLLDLLFGGEE